MNKYFLKLFLSCLVLLEVVSSSMDQKVILFEKNQPIESYIKYFIYPLGEEYWWRLPTPEANCSGPYQHFMSQNSGWC
jgi:hypothetical protein